MTNYYSVEPEVAGGWGSNTDATRVPGQPVKVNKLHYEFAGWLGDALVESTPCFVGTEVLARAIESAELTGVRFSDVEITKSDQFEELYSNRELPAFLWFQFEGEPQADDFGVTPDLQLVVSKRALAVLQSAGLSHAVIEPLD